MLTPHWNGAAPCPRWLASTHEGAPSSPGWSPRGAHPRRPSGPGDHGPTHFVAPAVGHPDNLLTLASVCRTLQA